MKKNYLFFFLIFCFLNSNLFAIDPPKDPMLRFNSVMHTVRLWRIDTDNKGKFLLTSSDDKTAKLWNTENGEFIRTFRIPIDKGNEGKIYACALSPDGNTVVLGGWTGWDWFKKSSIYIFNASTGEMIKRTGNFGDVIFDIEFSKDGRYLSVSLGSTNGVAILTTSDWKTYLTLDGYEDSVFNTSFDNTGRLVTVSYDMKIRLYDSDFKLIKTQEKNLSGEKPFSVAFSPDGSKIAVGYDDSEVLQVYDGKTLKLLYEPDITDTDQSNFLEMVDWSNDGNYLYAGGLFQKKIDDKFKYIIRKYSNGGKGDYTDLPVAGSTIMDIKTLPDDSIVFGSAQPDLGRIDKKGKTVFIKTGKIFSFANYQCDYLRLNDDASEIGFMPQYLNKLTFNINNRELTEGESSGQLYRVKFNKSTLTDYEDKTDPKLNGKDLDFLDTDELCRSATFTPSGKYILMGAEWNIYCLDSKGNRIWDQPVPGIAYGINATNDVCVVTYADGTIRWHRITDGQELLALFVDPDTLKWVLWTPKGYYDCSPGGQELVGWHVNNGLNKEADFYPASRFSEYYRPDIVNNILKTLDEDKAIMDANSLRGQTKFVSKSIIESLPPIVTILSTDNNNVVTADKVNIDIGIKTPDSNPVTEIKLMINGRPVIQNELTNLNIRSVDKSVEKKTIAINLSQGGVVGENYISVLVKNKNGYSEPAVYKITYKKSQTQNTQTDEFVIKPKLYILAVGVSKYDNPDFELQYSAKDAKDFVNLMAKQNNKLYREVSYKLLVDKDANKDGILNGLEWIQNQTTSKDVAMVFISGHGLNDNNGRLYYLPVNFNLENFKSTGLPADEITMTFSNIKGKVIYFMDTCHSGNLKLTTSRGIGEMDLTGLINELTSAENGTIVFCSSAGKQVSVESPEWGNGAFTKALLEGLGGKADYLGKGTITVNQLDLYISERVKELTKGKQTPVTGKPDTIRDFPVSITK
jgi:WD40 repeat protein